MCPMALGASKVSASCFGRHCKGLRVPSAGSEPDRLVYIQGPLLMRCVPLGKVVYLSEFWRFL